MSQTLIVHNDKSFVELLNLNLPIYIGTDVIVKNDYQDAHILIEHHPGIHLIICAGTSGKEATAEMILKLNQAVKKNVPIIVVGDDGKLKDSQQIVVLPQKPELKQVIQAAAKFLKVTPKKMIEAVVPDFFPIGINYCLYIKEAPCDIYFLTASEDYEKMYQSGEPLKLDDFQKLLVAGVREIYVDAPYRLKFVGQVNNALLAKLKDTKQSPDAKVAISDAALTLVKEEAIKGDNPVDKSTQELTTTAINTCMEIAKANPSVASLVKKLFANKTSYLYKHTQLIIQISNHILSNVEWGSQEQKEKLAFVSFFHDICLTEDTMAQLGSDNEVRTSKLTNEQKETVFKHARMSAEIVQKFPIAPIGSDVIILQHHGMTNGSGFAKTFMTNISPLAVVFIVAEDFAHMILELNNVDDLAERREAMLKQLTEKYNRSKFTKLVETLKTLPL